MEGFVAASRALRSFPKFAVVVVSLPQHPWPRYREHFMAAWANGSPRGGPPMRPPQWCSRGEPKPRKTGCRLPVRGCLYQLSSYIPGDVGGLGDRSPLCHHAGQFVGSCQPGSLRHLLNLDAYGEFHVNTTIQFQESGRNLEDTTNAPGLDRSSMDRQGCLSYHRSETVPV